MPRSSRAELPAWRRAVGDKQQHYWRPTPEGEAVSLCRLTLQSPSLRPVKKAGACPICREGLRRALIVREFCRGHIRLDGEAGGAPLEFEDWYWNFVILPIYGTLEPDGEGGYRRVYSKAIIGLPRWHMKSTGVAALSLYHMACEPIMGSEAFAVATTKKQAGLVLGKARRMVKADPLLSRVFSPGRATIECVETEATFTAIPHDADTAQGFHPAFSGIDEVHVHKSPAMIEAMVSGAAGFREPLTLLITTAGAERRGVWWELLKSWAKDPGAYIYWCGATDDDDPTDPAVWRRANPASWITDDMLLRQFRGMPLASFMRYHLNLAPRRGQNRVFTPQLWRACAELPRIDPERPCVVGVDASLRRDHTGVVLDQVGADGFHNAISFTFTAEEDDSIMSAIDHDQVGHLLRELAASYEVRRMPFDRAYFVRTMRELLTEGLPVEEFQQTNQNMARACQRLYDVVAEGRLRHGGDELLEEHVLNATVKETPFGWRITKTAAKEYIDLAIALAMAVDIAEVEAESSGLGVAVG
jgi:phage terminase large subunit-like protein